MTAKQEILCACSDGCAKDAEIERLRSYIKRLIQAAEHGGIAWMPLVAEALAAISTSQRTKSDG